jgi:hypothetical protein
MHQAADVVGMAMSDDHNIYLFRGISCGPHQVGKVPCGGHAPLPIARIEQDQFLAGVHERGNEMMIETGGWEPICLQEIVHGFGRLILAERRMRAWAHSDAV